MIVLSTTYFLASKDFVDDVYGIYESRVARANEQDFVTILFFSKYASTSEEEPIFETLLEQFVQENKGESTEGLELFRVDSVADLIHVEGELHIDTPDLEKLAIYLFMDDEHSLTDKYPSFVRTRELRSLENVLTHP